MILQLRPTMTDERDHVSLALCLVLTLARAAGSLIPLTPSKQSFVIFDTQALWRSAVSVRVPGCQKLHMTA